MTMKDLFRGYYRPSAQEFQDLWKNCIFIFDANVLLGLYRYPKTTREDFLKVLTHITDKIWIPHQVALEFQKNRIGAISDQINKFSEVEKLIDQVKTDLINRLNALQLHHRHSTINPDEFLANIETATRTFHEKLEDLKKGQFDISDLDIIRQELDCILNGKVGNPLSEQALTALYSEGDTRYQNKIPPGYSDQKTGIYSYNGLNLQRKFGDLILWFQIIEHAKEDKISHIIFVTDDEKEDWWWTYSGQTIGPRPELVEEISEKAGVRMFYMYKTPRFLEFAKNFLGIEVKQDSINQVDEIQRISAMGEFILLWVDLEKIIKYIVEPLLHLEERRSPASYIHTLLELKIISDVDANILKDLSQFRNSILHGMEDPTEEELRTHISELKILSEKMKQIANDFTRASEAIQKLTKY